MSNNLILSKRDWQKKHSRTRAKSRYGLTSSSVKRLQAGIMNSELIIEFAEKQSNRFAKLFVVFEGAGYPVVYDTKRRSLVTFLPPEAVDRKNRKFVPKRN